MASKRHSRNPPGETKKHQLVERCSKLLTRACFSLSGPHEPKQTANELRARPKGESAIVSAESRQIWVSKLSRADRRKIAETLSAAETLQKRAFFAAKATPPFRHLNEPAWPPWFAD